MSGRTATGSAPARATTTRGPGARTVTERDGFCDRAGVRPAWVRAGRDAAQTGAVNKQIETITVTHCIFIPVKTKTATEFGGRGVRKSL